MKCQACEEYFKKYSCGSKINGECDCPSCQGFCDCKSMIHESGLPMHRWLNPFKTPEERKLVAKYFKEHEAKEKARMLESLDQPPW